MYAVIDCNNFFVSCERIFQPQYEKRPVVVLSNNDGCVISRSQEAKDLEIPMGAPAFKYQKLFEAERVQIFSANFSLYSDISQRVMHLIAQAGIDMEVYSIDEAFLQFRTEEKEHILSRMHTMRQQILKQVGIPVSIGIAATKTLSKAANELAKQGEGVVWGDPRILPEIPVSDIWGIGRKLSRFLNDHGIFTAGQLSECDDDWVQKHLTVSGLKTVRELRGVSCIAFDEVPPARKSIISSKSFGKPVTTLRHLREAVATFTTRAAEKLRAEGEVAGYIGVSITTNFHRKQESQYYNSCSRRLLQPTSYTPDLIAAAVSITDSIFRKGYRYKKALVFLLGLEPENAVQLGLLNQGRDRPWHVSSEKRTNLMSTIDHLNNQLGSGTIQFGTQGITKEWKQRRQMRSARYTTSWKELAVVR